MNWKDWFQKNRVLASRRGVLGILGILCITLIALVCVKFGIEEAIVAAIWAIASIALGVATATAFQNKDKPQIEEKKDDE